jgi:WD40 repeat protein
MKRWDAATGKPLPLQLKGLPAKLKKVTLSHDGAFLAVTCRDHLVRLWNMESGKQATLEGPAKHIAAGAEIWSLRGHTLDVNDCVFSPDGERLATASTDKTVRVWDLITGQEALRINTPQGFVTCIRMISDGRLLIGAGLDRRINIWDASPMQDKE